MTHRNSTFFGRTVLFLSVLLIFACKKDTNPTLPPPPDPIPAWKLDSGIYDPNSYFPLRLGAYWLYENSDGSLDSVLCYDKAISVADTSFKIENYHFMPSSQQKDRSSLGCYKGYWNVCKSNPCGFKIYLFWPEQNAYEFAYSRSCMYFIKPGQSAQQAQWFEKPDQFCISADTSVDGFDHVKVYRNIEFDETNLDTFAYEPASPSSNFWKITSIRYKPTVTFEDHYYAQGIGRIRSVYYDAGILVNTQKLIRYRIQ